jgi:DNA-binding NarL/FixJ family response regulator
VVVAGLRALLNADSEFLLAESADSLSDALDLIHENQMDVLLIDKAFGVSAICGWTQSLLERGKPTPAIVVWCAVISAADTMKLIHAGVRGVPGDAGEARTIDTSPTSSQGSLASAKKADAASYVRPAALASGGRLF